MNIYGTLGFTPAKFLPSLRQRSDVERAVVFHDQHADSKKAAQQVALYCRDLGIAFEHHEVDAFDIVASAAAMQERVRKDDPNQVLFNVTGGTKVVSSAAVLTCILEGLRAVYIHEETHDEIALPLITAPYHKLLSAAQRRVLSFIADHTDCNQRQLVDALGSTKPTITHHIKELERYGLVEKRPHPEDSRRKLLRVIPSARLLLGGGT